MFHGWQLPKGHCMITNGNQDMYKVFQNLDGFHHNMSRHKISENSGRVSFVGIKYGSTNIKYDRLTIYLFPI